MIEIINDKLFIDQIPARTLAEKYGTPLFVLSEDSIIEKCQELRSSFLNKYTNTRVAYAGKAFLTLAMCKIVEREGFHLDVVSGGELYTAIKADFPPDRIEFNGNNKSPEELQMAIDYGVGRIIIDGFDELSLINQCALTEKINVVLRISPGVDSHTHEYVTTGNLDSKFGIPIQDHRLELLINQLLESKVVNLMGFHFHVGSQINENVSHLLATKILMEKVKEFKEKFDYIPAEINVGGGFGVRYTDEDHAKSYSYFLDPIMEIINAAFVELNSPKPTVVIEPGRSIIANAGVTLYTVGAIKDIPGIRKYVSVDGGMTDNPRPALYNSKYDCFIENDQVGQELITVCGKCCESGDILLTDVMTKPASRGDLLAIFSTGAYCYAMSSNYNKIPFLPIVLTSDGKERLIVKRQTFDELISRELF